MTTFDFVLLCAGIVIAAIGIASGVLAFEAWQRAGILKRARASHKTIDIDVRVRARIVDDSNAHGPCLRLELDRRDFAEPRVVWVSLDEIMDVREGRP